ncbi:hypothetical protein DSO57_1021843 [Entomophthora muscae]|uniref:Uncharacterized protein n=1 Tax=Entomophthora muscae TaxID=34485 RepID=A0ACC2RHX1_9FUNG|nr:hypothetical protein DSO57_1021843 [Entomophthora muscae]
MGGCKILKALFFIAGLVDCVGGHGKQEAEEAQQPTMANVALGFGLVLFGATLSTLGAMVLYLDKVIRKVANVEPDFSLAKSNAFLSSSLSFSAGVLAVTIFLNLLPEGFEAFETSNLLGKYSQVVAASYFALCMCLVLGLKLISRRSKNGEVDPQVIIEKGEETSEVDGDAETMKRLGYEIALAISIHNFPEGVVTFVAAYKSIKGGLLFGIALALHKFPEGIMIGVPIFAGTGSKWKAAAITAAASFITQLFGAAFAYALSKVFWNDIIAGLLFLLAAAILTNTLFGGMLPLARQYDKHDRYSSAWLAAGITLFVFLTSIMG